MDGLDRERASDSQLADLVDVESAAAASVRNLDPAWLRGNCQCADCRDPASGQRLASITDQPAGVRLASVTDTADGWVVRFGPDGHESVFTRAWLDRQLTAVAEDRTEDAKQMWTVADFPAGPPSVSWTDYLTSDATRLLSLRQLLSAGFMLLRGVPAEHGAVLTADGGESGLLDGFRAAARLRADDRAAFDCLTRTPVTFGYRDATAELRATRPMIGLDVAGRIREVRYNSRSMQPMRPPRGSAPGQASLQMQEFYRAYRTFATTLLHQDLTLRFSLEPGDCVVFDNTRVLHSRTGFTATGHRHLQGCYAEIDGTESTVAVLARRDAVGLTGG